LRSGDFLTRRSQVSSALTDVALRQNAIRIDSIDVSTVRVAGQLASIPQLKPGFSLLVFLTEKFHAMKGLLDSRHIPLLALEAFTATKSSTSGFWAIPEKTASH
jgi:hypothetical protein